MAGGFRSPFLPFGISSPAATPVAPETEATLLTIPTSWRQLGLSVIYGDNLCVEYPNPAIGSLNEKIESYTHEIRAIGGFWSCSITFKDNPSEVREWLENGVGRHIEVFDQAGVVVWEGFVDRVSATIENVQISRGPLISSGVANRVKVRYSVADYSISPPSVGVTLTSATSNHTGSQARYGIIERVLSLNEVTQTIATQIRDSWLREHAYPQSAINSSYAQNSEPSVTLECLGYWHYLNTWIYTSSSTSTQSVTSKLQAVLDSSPNDIFPDDYPYVVTNSTQVKQSETQDRSAGTIISELMGISDSSNSKYVGGIYEGRHFHYKVVPEILGYYQETGRTIKNNQGSMVLPWEVQPGNWIYYAGLLPDSGRVNSLDDLYQSPVAGFIETVSFSSPFEVSISTQRLSKLDQMFARMGMTSV